MTIDSPLTCYICGKTKDTQTVDLLGTLKDSEKASKRFKEKFGKEPDSFLFICAECRKKNPAYAKNVEKKYGIVTLEDYR